MILTDMQSHILSLATAVPRFSLSQSELADRVCSAQGFEGTDAERLRKIYRNSTIERRYTVIDEFGQDPWMFGKQVPGTKSRNDLYKEHAPRLAEEAARKALGPEPITHIVSVSCTGMMAPGIEYLLIDQLGLNRDVQRLAVNFMGCFGAFKGLAVADAIAQQSPDHRVLVVCTELCSLHFQHDRAVDTVIANGLFADGAAAVVVGSTPRPGEKPLFALEQFASRALPDSLDHMTWDASDFGYVMRLSYEVPAKVRGAIRNLADELKSDHLPLEQHGWAIHPGGKAILHGIAQTLDLTRDDLSASYEVLRQYGNMSSPTFLFVLDQIKSGPENLIGFGFGPGLSMEGVRLRRCEAQN